MLCSAWAPALKKTRVAGERDEAARQAFGAAVQQVPLDKLVFFDECGFALNLHRLYGWLLGGGRLEEQVPFQKGHNRSVVGAFSLPDAAHPTGVRALWQKKGAWNAHTFTLFVQEAVLPDLPQGSVLVLDNATIHKSSALREAVEEAGCSLLFLPPYSPDLNPIELFWSWLKQIVRLAAPRDDKHRRELLYQIALSLSPQHAQAWFHHCGLG